MRHGIVLFTSDRGITPAASAAERNGFDTFFVPEHTHIPVKREAAHPDTGDATLPDDRYLRTLGPWVSLANAASRARRPPRPRGPAPHRAPRVRRGDARALGTGGGLLRRGVRLVRGILGVAEARAAPPADPGRRRRGPKTFAWIAAHADGWITTPREDLAQWEEAGVTEVIWGVLDRSADEVEAYLERLILRG